MDAALKAQLVKAGYTEAEIAREAKIMERTALENARIRDDRAWNYGLHAAQEV